MKVLHRVLTVLKLHEYSLVMLMLQLHHVDSLYLWIFDQSQCICNFAYIIATHVDIMLLKLLFLSSSFSYI